MVVGYKGRFKYLQFNAMKPDKFHIKMFGLCDSLNGFTFNLLPYFGRETAYDPAADEDGESAIKVFQTLTAPLTKRHHTFADRYYTTRNLIEFLKKKHFYYTRMIQVNSRSFPPEIKSINLKHQEKKYFINDSNEALVVTWRDKKAKKPCLMISINANTENVDVRTARGVVNKPSAVHL